MDRLTRDVMANMQRDLGTQLDWIAVAHFNTDHPHVHVALRGIRDDGGPLELSRDYVKSGIRNHAERACTFQLGYRTSLDAAAAQQRESTAQRLTSLDRIIARSSSTEHTNANASHFVSQQHGQKSASVLARLQALRSMGLAAELDGGTWLIRRDFQNVLRTMQQIIDRQKMLAKHGALISDPRLPMQVSDMRKLKQLHGRVLLHGEDEQTGRPSMFVEGVDAKIHVIQYTPEIADARRQGQLKPNSFVRLRRCFENGRGVLEIADHGDAEKLLRNKKFIASAAAPAQGPVQTATKWSGWLGRYHEAVAAERQAKLAKPKQR
ncbi:MAG: relaxase/mobilization nuclease domain-containing protein [Bryobacterales bacterium]|nr:relaxase/mobilization nuclease domain-containing protein [Bryobacterales bacterium]